MHLLLQKKQLYSLLMRLPERTVGSNPRQMRQRHANKITMACSLAKRFGSIPLNRCPSEPKHANQTERKCKCVTRYGCKASIKKNGSGSKARAQKRPRLVGGGTNIDTFSSSRRHFAVHRTLTGVTMVAHCVYVSLWGASHYAASQLITTSEAATLCIDCSTVRVCRIFCPTHVQAQDEYEQKQKKASKTQRWKNNR